MSKSNWAADFSVADKVIVDDESGRVYTVTAVLFRLNAHPQYEVSWLTPDGQKTAWVEQYRMEEVLS